MSKTYINGELVNSSTNFAAAIEYTNKDGNKTTVQDKIDNIIEDMGGLRFGIDSNGNYGYIKAGADTVIPFSNLTKADLLYEYIGRSGSGANIDYKACGYTLTEAQCKKYSYYIYSMMTLGCNCISYSGISTYSMPNGAILLYNQGGNAAGQSVSGSTGVMDYKNILFLVPKQNSPATFTASGRGGLMVKLFGIYGD